MTEPFKMREDEEEEVEKAKISEPVKTVDDLLLQDELTKLQEVRFLFAVFFQTLIKILLFYNLNLIFFLLNGRYIMALLVNWEIIIYFNFLRMQIKFFQRRIFIITSQNR